MILAGSQMGQTTANERLNHERQLVTAGQSFYVKWRIMKVQELACGKSRVAMKFVKFFSTLIHLMKQLENTTAPLNDKFTRFPLYLQIISLHFNVKIFPALKLSTDFDSYKNSTALRRIINLEHVSHVFLNVFSTPQKFI